MDNIFNKDDTSDLPPEVIMQLSKKTKANRTEMIRSLLDYNQSLNADELIVGLYRKFKVVITRQCIHAVMGPIVCTGWAEKTGDSWCKVNAIKFNEEK